MLQGARGPQALECEAPTRGEQPRSATSVSVQPMSSSQLSHRQRLTCTDSFIGDLLVQAVLRELGFRWGAPHAHSFPGRLPVCRAEGEKGTHPAWPTAALRLSHVTLGFQKHTLAFL